MKTNWYIQIQELHLLPHNHDISTNIFFFLTHLKVLINLTQGGCFYLDFSGSFTCASSKAALKLAQRMDLYWFKKMYQKLKNYQLCKCTESTPQGAKKFLLFRVLQPLKDLQDPLKYLQEQEGSLVHLCEQAPARESEIHFCRTDHQKPLTYFCITWKLFII